MSESIFEKGLKIDISKHVEKKGRFNYLSWTFAVCELRKLDPKAMWEVKHFNNYPYMDTKAGCFVEVVVTLSDESSFAQVHPVLDNSNKTLTSPNAFQINTSIQRCLVKAIALASGIGLSLYAGEDLPTNDKEEKKATKELSFEEKVNWFIPFIGEEFVSDCLTKYKYNSAKEVKEKDREEILEDLKKQHNKIKGSQSHRND